MASNKTTEQYIAALNPANDTRTIIAAIKWVGENKLEEATQALLILCKDPRDGISFQAITALKKIGVNNISERLNDINTIEAVNNTGTIEAIGNFSSNEVARRLNSIGDTLFIIIFIIAVLMIAVPLFMLGGRFGGMFALPMIVVGIVNIIIAFVIKTLFNGFAENIQILHDIRNDIRSSNNK